MSKIVKEDLDDYIVATSQKANRIKHIDELLANMPDSRAKTIYVAEMMDMIAEYHIQVDILEIMVNDFLQQKDEESGEIPLVYYKLAKDLKET